MANGTLYQASAFWWLPMIDKAYHEQPGSIWTHIHLHAVAALQCGFWEVRFLVLSLAPLADDVSVTRCVLGFDCSMCAVNLIRFVLSLQPQEDMVHADPCPSQTIIQTHYIALAVIDIVFVCCAVTALRQRTAARIQSGMWRSMSVYLLLSFPANLWWASHNAGQCNNFQAAWWWAIGDLLVFYVVQRPRVRHMLQARIGRRSDARITRTAAAVIAGLIGDCSVDDPLAQAFPRFQIIAFPLLDFHDLTNNAPNPDLAAHATSVNLGECDAFLSHSWHDDATAKWVAMQTWRSDLKEKRNREPVLWFDKFCIDQNNIETDLRCLPIFLSGCSRFVMLCGPTYLSRLWCIMEIFTYVYIGGRTENIEIVPVVRRGHEQEDMASIQNSFKTFDAHQCLCSQLADKKRMLLIICTAFGDLCGFNYVVQQILEQVAEAKMQIC